MKMKNYVRNLIYGVNKIILRNYFHTLIVLSPEPDTILEPSGDTHTECTQDLCPFRVRNKAPDDISHTLTVVSREPETILEASGDTQTENT